jgi:Polysaccharide lyase
MACAERTEIAFAPQYAEGIEINLSYGFTIESKAENTSSWLLLGQFHEHPANGPPPFAVEMSGEHMVIVIRYQLASQTAPTHRRVYYDPIPIQRGQNYFMNIQVNFDNGGKGYLNVWRDGVRIVRHHGPIGYGSGQTYYWKEGIYRAPATEMMAVRYQSMLLRPLLLEPHQ